MTRKPTIEAGMTAQDLFNASYWGVVEQGQPCLGRHGSCEYEQTRGGAVLMCSIGHCLTQPQRDDFMASMFKGLVAFDDHDPRLPPQIGGNFYLSCDLQSAHDQAADDHRNDGGMAGLDVFVKSFGANMARVAAKYGLEVPK